MCFIVLVYQKKIQIKYVQAIFEYFSKALFFMKCLRCLKILWASVTEVTHSDVSIVGKVCTAC